MKIIHLGIYQNNTEWQQLRAFNDTKDMWFWQKEPAQQIFNFISTEMLQRIHENAPYQVQHLANNADPGGFYCHLYKSQGIGLSVITDREYPHQVAKKIMSIMYKQYLIVNLEQLRKDFLNPNIADKVYNIQSNIDKTASIMVKNINLMIDRGENINTLIDKTTHLSKTSKAFLKNAKKTNNCCVIV